MNALTRLLAAALVTTTAVANAQYYDGRWDSTVYVYSDHPRTVALRVEVRDEETRQPLRNMEVTLSGEWQPPSRFGPSPVETFELGARTDSDGVVVFGLTWQKISRYEDRVDDIEKAQTLSVQGEGYRYIEYPISLAYLAGDEVEWKQLVATTPGAKYFLMERTFRE